MTTTQRSTVVGVFESTDQAEQAVRALRDAGFAREQIGFVRRHPKAEAETSSLAAEPIAVGAATGGAAGTLAGGVLGGLLGVAVTAMIPGFGLVIGAGVIVSALGGAYVGSLLGTLVGMGIAEEEARFYQEELESGRALVTVKADDRYSEALAILADNGAYDVTRQARAAPAGYASSP